MYFYIYDQIAQDKKCEKEVFAIEQTLTDIGIFGPKEKVGLLKSVQESLRVAKRNDARNIIVVGGDLAFLLAAKEITRNYLPYSLGFIPLDPNSQIAKLLSMPYGVRSCAVVSARMIKKIKLGLCNDKLFFNRAQVQSTSRLSFQVWNKKSLQYRLDIPANSNFIISNLNKQAACLSVNIKSGDLENKSSFWSKIFKKQKKSLDFSKILEPEFSLKSPQDFTVLLDNNLNLETSKIAQCTGKEFNFSLFPEELEVIVGSAILQK